MIHFLLSRCRYLILLGCCCWGCLLAQSPQPHPSLSPQEKTTLLGFEDKKHLLKWDLMSLYRQRTVTGFIGLLSLGYEQKIRPSWSIASEAGMVFRYQGGSPPLTFEDGILMLSLAPRFYYDMGRRVRLGSSGNNFSGNYLSFQVTGLLLNARNRNSLQQEQPPFLYLNQLILAPVYGIQRQVFSFGFIDLNLGLQLLYARSSGSLWLTPYAGQTGWFLFPISQLRVGFAL